MVSDGVRRVPRQIVLTCSLRTSVFHDRKVNPFKCNCKFSFKSDTAAYTGGIA
jgi:hypothetical protein